MRAVVLREPGRPVATETVLLAPPRRGEVLVRVVAAGVCHSDVHLADGRLGGGRWPMVLGHEGAGVVQAVGEDVTEVAPGDHVAFCFVPACGACPACRAGRRTLCETAARNGVAGMLMDGSSRLRALDGTVLQHGLMVGLLRGVRGRAGGRRGARCRRRSRCGRRRCSGAAWLPGSGRSTAPACGSAASVCVIGCGGVGLQVIAGARLAGAGTIVAVDRRSGQARARASGAAPPTR